MICACIFDMDGTVANTLASIAGFGNRALEACGYPPCCGGIPEPGRQRRRYPHARMLTASLGRYQEEQVAPPSGCL